MSRDELWKGKNNLVLVGESGCGKTELALHLAREIGRSRRVRLIDMDQTKGMFRSRDFAGKAGFESVEFLCGQHFMDMPTVPPGMAERLTDQSSVNVIDAGGNETGAVCLGQFSRWLQGQKTVVLYVINPYRNFSGRLEDVCMVMDRIKAFGRLEDMRIVSSLNLGRDTLRSDVISGFERLRSTLSGGALTVECVAVPDWIETEDGDFDGLPVLHITPAICYP